MAVKFFTALPQRISGLWRPAGYEIDPTGFRQGSLQYMIKRGQLTTTFDDGAVEGVEWTRQQGTITYPTGDNGHVHVDETDYTAGVFGNLVEDPPAEALGYQFTVTAAMVDVDTSAFTVPCPVLLALSLSGSPQGWAANRTIRLCVTVNDVVASTSVATLLSSRLTIGRMLRVPVKVDDVVKVYLWQTAGAGESVIWRHLVATPHVSLFRPGPAHDGKMMLVHSPTLRPGLAWLATAPAGVAATIAGSTTDAINVATASQNGVDAGLVSTSGTNSNLGWWLLRLPFSDQLGAFHWSPQTVGSDSNSVVDPYVFRVMRYTTVDMWTAIVDIDAITGA